MFTREEVFMISGLEAHHIAVESLDQALKDHATTGRKRPSTTGPDVGSGIPQLLAKGLISLRDEARARKIRTIPSRDPVTGKPVEYAKARKIKTKRRKR